MSRHLFFTPIMRTTDLLRISGRQVFKQYRKNIGVMLSIVFGTAGLIVVLTMGNSIEESISNDLEIIGNATRLRIIFKHMSAVHVPVDNREFRMETVDGLRDIPGVDYVSAIVVENGFARLVNMNNISYFSLIGVDSFFWKVHGSKALSGRLISREDLQQRSAVCVLGQRTAQEVFGRLDVVGQFINVDKNMLKIIGVLEPVSMPDKVRDIFLPLTTTTDRIDSISPVNKIYIRCHSWDDVDNVIASIPHVIKKFQPDKKVEIFLSKEILKRIKSIALGVKIFVQLALVSTFILGGIGIWNIMMMSIRARTKEIGLKKAIGAEDYEILFQFLTESLMLSTSAMFFGFFLGWAGVSIASSIVNKVPPKELFWMSVVIGFSFSLFLGIVAGLAPAIKASRMEVVSALRYE